MRLRDNIIYRKISYIGAVLCFGVFFAVFLTVSASALTVKEMRLGATDQNTRLVLEFDAEPRYEVFTLADPYRVVVDIKDLRWRDDIKVPDVKGVVKLIRPGQFTPTVSRVVIEPDGPVEVRRKFTLKPTAGKPWRLVVDLASSNDRAFRTVISERRGRKRARVTPQAQQPAPRIQKRKKTKPVIVLDAGHGGLDPGARGKRVREKDIVLTFTREFAAVLRKSGRYKVYLTRKADVYLPLRTRIEIARRHEADLFMSIHADAISRRNVRGMSVYTLSERASDAEAAALARKENKSDIIAGADFAHIHPDAAPILIEMGQRETKNKSIQFANKMVATVKKSNTRLLERPHRYAGFVVLKAPDVPSVLVELGFLTNRQDERLLMSRSWRNSVAQTLTRAVHDYFTAR